MTSPFQSQLGVFSGLLFIFSCFRKFVVCSEDTVEEKSIARNSVANTVSFKGQSFGPSYFTSSFHGAYESIFELREELSADESAADPCKQQTSDRRHEGERSRAAGPDGPFEDSTIVLFEGMKDRLEPLVKASGLLGFRRGHACGQHGSQGESDEEREDHRARSVRRHGEFLLPRHLGR